MDNEEKGRLSTDEIMTMCEKLASKYRQHHIRGDLVSEGVLAVYERLEVKPDDYPASLWRRANKAMYDYINIKTKAVKIPTGRRTESVAKKVNYKDDYSEEGIRLLEEAINSTVVSYDDTFMDSVPDCTDMYEDKDFIEKAMALLTSKEKDIIKMRYYDGMTQDDLAIFYGGTRQNISLWETKALTKMSKV